MKEKIVLAASIGALAVLISTGVLTAAQALEFARNILELAGRLSYLAQAS